jgi:hypothetical protein
MMSECWRRIRSKGIALTDRMRPPSRQPEISKRISVGARSRLQLFLTLISVSTWADGMKAWTVDQA